MRVRLQTRKSANCERIEDETQAFKPIAAFTVREDDLQRTRCRSGKVRPRNARFARKTFDPCSTSTAPPCPKDGSARHGQRRQAGYHHYGAGSARQGRFVRTQEQNQPLGDDRQRGKGIAESGIIFGNRNRAPGHYPNIFLSTVCKIPPLR